MMDLLACAQNKLHDPVVMNWALRRYRQADLRGSGTCREMERLWFHDLTLNRWLDSDDADVLASVFRELPARLFANLKPAILSRWAGWSGTLGASATPALVECAREEAALLFGRHIDERAADLNKSFAVLSAIIELPPDAAHVLLDEAILSVARFEDKDIGKPILAQALLRPALRYNEKHFWELVHICARCARLDKERGARLPMAVFSALAESGDLMTLTERYFESDGDVSYASLAGLFRPGAPLEDCDRIAREASPWPGAKALLEAHSGASAETAKAAAVCRIFEEEAEIKPSALAAFAIASTLQAFEIERIAAGSLSLDEALDLLGLDVPECRHFEQLAQCLSGFEKGEVAEAIGERLPALTDKWGSLHLAKMAGHLRLESTAGALLDCLSDETGDYLCEAASDALAQFGDIAASMVVARWDGLDRSQQIYGRGLLEKIGGEAACQFALDRFDQLFHEDHQEWCCLIEGCPDVRAIRLIEPQLSRGQPVIDECYYLLRMLADEEDGLETIRQRVWRHRKQVLDHRAKFEGGNLDELFKTLNLALRCEKCGDVNQYEIKAMVVGKSESGSPPFVRDDLRCASCGQWADFELMPGAQMQIMAALLVRLAQRDSQGDGMDSEETFQAIDVHYRWRTRPAPDVMAELKAAMNAQPDNIVNHLRLARLQYVFGRRGRSEECYRNALRLEPNSMEAGLGLARILLDAGQERQAFNKLRQMLETQADWRFFRTDELPPKKLADEFTSLFNKLHAALGVRDAPLLHGAAFETRRKIGRNDPCPCGSGAKYKKCCGGSRSAQAR